MKPRTAEQVVAASREQDMPKRVQMSRQKPWRVDHPGAVIVSRPSRWGNPCRWVPGPSYDGMEFGRVTPAEARRIATDGFWTVLLDDDVRALNNYPTDDEIRDELGGRDLACWCPLDQPCHADVLLLVANPELFSEPTNQEWSS